MFLRVGIPLLFASTVFAWAVPNSYLVKLKPSMPEITARQHHGWVQKIHSGHISTITELQERGESQADLFERNKLQGITTKWDFGDDHRGYGIHTTDLVIDEIRKHPDVEYVTQDQYVYAPDYKVPTKRPLGTRNQQENAPWGLGRISHQNHGNASWPYNYSTTGLGKGIDIYIFDTGINIDHDDFEPARIVANASMMIDETIQDFHGHGTHCAGTIAGKIHGIAKEANIIPIKVLGRNGTGSFAFTIVGWYWALHLHSKRKNDTSFIASVFSMSLGTPQGFPGDFQKWINTLLAKIAKEGVYLVAAAGNEGQDACTVSPASSTSVITVGAVASNDSFAKFSARGSCVDLNAPGVNIVSAGLKSKTDEAIMDGTSMACAHVAGVIASLLSRRAESNKTPITVAQMKKDLLQIASKGLISEETLPENTANAIVYNGGAELSYDGIISRGGWPECCN